MCIVDCFVGGVVLVGAVLLCASLVLWFVRTFVRVVVGVTSSAVLLHVIIVTYNGANIRSLFLT